jgi:N-acetylmuramoyl-L-alanine amidase
MAVAILLPCFQLSGADEKVFESNAGYISLNALTYDMGLELHWDALLGRIDLIRSGKWLTLFLDSQIVLGTSGRVDYLEKKIAGKNGEIHLPLEVLRSLYRELSLPGEMWTFRESAQREMRLTNLAPENKKEDPKITPPATPMKGINLIVLDAGHGGSDPGVVGYQGAYESTLVLDVTKRVENKLKGLSCRVELTRKGNETVSLIKRSEMANGFLAAGHKGIFVSIHANGSLDARARGYETYFLSPRASDAEARRVAALENGSLAADIPQNDEGALDAIFSNMLVEEHRWESVMLSEGIQKALKKEIGRQSPDRGVRKANFSVIRYTYMPSVLVEIGFITNPDEAKLLATADYREKIANGIAEGIRNFLTAAETGR